MPELPEVETIRRQLEPEVTARRIVGADVLDERWTRPEAPRGVERMLAGRTIEAVERRGQNHLLAPGGRRGAAEKPRGAREQMLVGGGGDPPPPPRAPPPPRGRR